MPIITNICAKLDIDCKLDLKYLGNTNNFKFLTQRKYRPNKFSALITKYKDTKLTLLIFHNGQVILTGAKNENQIEKCAKRLIKAFEIYGAHLKSLKIINYCASHYIGHRIDLYKLAKLYPKNSSLEPELFPGLKFTINKKTFTIHYTGKLFTTGFINKNLLNKYFNYVMFFIKTCKKVK